MSSSEPVDWRGPMIAQNAQGYPSPVFYDPHTAIMNNKSGGTAILGSPGAGKSFLGMTLAMMSAVSGKQTVYWDPKNDSIGMAALEDEIGEGNIDIWDLNSPTEAGSLDPFTSDTKQERISKALNLVEILIGGRRITDFQRVKLKPIISDLANDRNASMERLITLLLKHREESIRALGTELDSVRLSNPMSRILFKPRDKDIQKKQFNDGFTIITTLGLKLPSPDVPQDNYKSADRVAIAITYFITQYIYDVMKESADKRAPKSVFIDEAWSILSTENGKTLIADLLRLGRSMNTACILMTQSIKDLNDEGIRNAITSEFAFRSQDHNEALRLCRSLGITAEYADAFLDLQSGYCFLKDWNNRVSVIHILEQSRKWSQAFETNPAKRMEILKRNEARRQIEQQHAQE